MNCSCCGKPIDESLAVVSNGYYFCNNLCKYSFKTNNKSNKTKIGLQKNNNKNTTPSLQIYVNKRDNLADFESFLNNKYTKIVFAIFIALIGFLIYKGIENLFENKQLFRILWICIFSVGFIVTSAVKKQNKTHSRQNNIEKQEIEKSNSNSFFDNSFFKIVLAVLLALLIYRGISDYIEYKQAEAALKELDKTFNQFEKDMNKYLRK